MKNALNDINNIMENLMLMLSALFRYFFLMPSNSASNIYLLYSTFLSHGSNLHLFVIKMALNKQYYFQVIQYFTVKISYENFH